MRGPSKRALIASLPNEVDAAIIAWAADKFRKNVESTSIESWTLSLQEVATHAIENVATEENPCKYPLYFDFTFQHIAN
jgi:hypothetical protein